MGLWVTQTIIYMCGHIQSGYQKVTITVYIVGNNRRFYAGAVTIRISCLCWKGNTAHTGKIINHQIQIGIHPRMGPLDIGQDTFSCRYKTSCEWKTKNQTTRIGGYHKSGILGTATGTGSKRCSKGVICQYTVLEAINIRSAVHCKFDTAVTYIGYP